MKCHGVISSVGAWLVAVIHDDINIIYGGTKFNKHHNDLSQ